VTLMGFLSELVYAAPDASDSGHGSDGSSGGIRMELTQPMEAEKRHLVAFSLQPASDLARPDSQEARRGRLRGLRVGAIAER